MGKHPGRDDIYTAAQQWSARCLKGDGSMLSAEHLWTSANTAELVRCFVEQPDQGDRSFSEKLADQLGKASPGATKLTAEMLWLMVLFLANYKPATKRELVKKVWLWSGAPFDDENAALSPFAHGIGNGGPGYNNFRPFELQLVIRFIEAWKARKSSEPDLTADPWSFAEWFDELPDATSRQFRHMILHLLFPDTFERCASSGDKRKIELAFRARLPIGGNLGKPTSPLELDRRIGAIRQLLESESPGTTVDFYSTKSVRDIWNPEEDSGDSEPVDPDPDPALPAKSTRRVWLIAAGEGAALWPAFRAAKEITIGWGALGDLSKYKTEESVRKALQEQDDSASNPVNNVRACFDFAQSMQIGDEVYIKQGWKRILARGLITGSYKYDPDREGHCNVRTVDWLQVMDVRLPPAHRLPTKTLTEITSYSSLLKFIREQSAPGAAPALKAYGVDDVMAEAFLPRQKVDAILGSLRRRKNVILQGPPGVGKSFLARKLAYALLGAEAPDNVVGIQFHQSYSYEDFIQGWRPDGEGKFGLRNGRFYEFCKNAQEAPDEKHVFIIDEINRGNLSKIFGELMYLIEADKRGASFALPLTYGNSISESFYLPPNLYIIGLMNTADRSLAMVDYALRRRFAFHDLEPMLSADAFAEQLKVAGVNEATVNRIRKNVGAVNARIEGDRKNLGKGFAIGHSYFCPNGHVPDSAAWYESIVREELLPLLDEYWFDEPKRVKECQDLLES